MQMSNHSVPTNTPDGSAQLTRGAAIVAGDYRELVRAIHHADLLRRRPAYYVLVGLGNLVALASIVAGLVLLHDSWWAIALAPAYAVVSTQIAFFSHDAAHLQIARGRKAVAALCLVHGNLLNALGYGWWTEKHNAHHAHPNDLEHDPDVAVGAFVWDSDQVTERRGFAAWMTRHQAGMFFPILTLEAFNLRISSVRSVLSPGVRFRKTEASLLLAHFVLYGALLVTTLTWAQTLVFLVVHQALFGVYLGCSFAPSHKGMPTLTPEQADDPLLRQVLVSRNVRGGRFVRVLLGGLNLQIEHHLFPSMPRPSLPRAQVLIRQHCRDRGIPYAEASLLGAYAMGLQHMHRVGTPLRG